ncbi:MAG TPA: hypothetical protein VGS12_13330 [Caulobacteraceae bacterium]|nr:hypothetical protein [Caulobacteraceae bacterium]
MRRAARGDDGFVLLAAVLGVAAFAAIVLMVLATDRGALLETRAGMERARLDAAADAGLMIAVHGLGENAGPGRWTIDGTVRQADFDGVDLQIRIEDERGKAPLGDLDRAQARALFIAAGAAGPRAEALAEEYTDWQLADDDVETGGVTSADYAGLPFAPRHGRFRTVGELMALKDMNRPIFERLAGSVTVFFGESGPFLPEAASPVAAAAMAGDQPSSGFDQLHLDRLTLDKDETASLVGRPLRIVVRATAGAARAEQSAIVEFTGSPDQPYWVRYADMGEAP